MENLVDFHVHIDYYKNFREVYDYYHTNKIYTLFVTNLPQIFEKAKVTFHESKYVKLALGYHPDKTPYERFNKRVFDRNILETKYVGEVGLDFTKQLVGYKGQQLNTFDYICNQASMYNRIMTIHSRRAEKETLEILLKNNVRFAVFHWYSGSKSELKNIIDSGYYFSLNPSMMNSNNGRDIVKYIPTDRLLIESDGPFGKFNNRPFQPQDLKNVYDKFEAIIGVSDLRHIVISNLRRLLNDQLGYLEK